MQLQGRVLVARASGIQAVWSPTVSLPVLQSAVGTSIRQELAMEIYGAAITGSIMMI